MKVYHWMVLDKKIPLLVEHLYMALFSHHHPPRKGCIALPMLAHLLLFCALAFSMDSMASSNDF